MLRVLANNLTIVRFGPVEDAHSPTPAEIDGAMDLTKFLISFENRSAFTASALDTKDVYVSAVLYLDDENVSWDSLPNGAEGSWLVWRLGRKPKGPMEIYPTIITSRTLLDPVDNDRQRFRVEASISSAPLEDGRVVA